MATLIKEASQIKSEKVRLVLTEGSIIVDKAEALKRALTEEKDLVLVAEGDPAVVKMVDFTKVEYEKQKSQKGNKSKKNKTIQIGPHTQEHDLVRFAKQAAQFIEEGHTVSVRLEVRGRDKGFRELIAGHMKSFVAKIPCAKPGRLNISEDGSTYTQTLN